MGRLEHPMPSTNNLLSADCGKGYYTKNILFMPTSASYSGGISMLPKETKFCPGCKIDLPYSSFGLNRSRYDGYQHYCRSCKAAFYPKKKDGLSREKYLANFQQERDARLALDVKHCPACHTDKPFAEFYKSVNRADGHNGSCIQCMKGVLKIYFQNNKQDYYERKKQWYLEHPEYSSDYARRYYAANPEKEKARHIRYASTDIGKQKHRADVQRRRHLKRTNGAGDFTGKEWEEMKTLYDYTCLCCGRKEPDIKLTQDHILPVTKGGIHTASNIQPLCFSCNCSKSTKQIDYRPKANDAS